MSLTSLIKGIGIGAGTTYLFDPVAGARRRSLIRDQFVSAVHGLRDFFDRAIRDLGNRWNGVVAETRAVFSPEQVSDDRVAQRVRATLGRYVSHPHAIEVSVHDGCVAVSGPIMAEDVQPFVRAIERVRGVRCVENQLDVHTQADISSLQGGATRGSQLPELLQENWSPGIRLLAAGTGMALMLNCAVQRRPMAIALGTVGFGLFLRAVTNQSTKRLLGDQQTRPGRREPSASKGRNTAQKAGSDGEPYGQVQPIQASGEDFQ